LNRGKAAIEDGRAGVESAIAQERNSIGRPRPDGRGKFFSFDDDYLIASNRSSKVQYDELQYITADCIAV
jgi:hypothetical protein